VQSRFSPPGQSLIETPFPVLLRFLIAHRDCDGPDVDCAIEKENIKAVAFSRTGDVFIAVSDTMWFLWKFTESSKFRLAMQGEHEFVSHLQSCRVQLLI
jgi:hypothetical protein